MTVVRLQRHAPEAQNATSCAVCGTTDKRRVTDHIQVRTPGAPQLDEGVCESCGAVIDHVVDGSGRRGDVRLEDRVYARQQFARLDRPGHQPVNRAGLERQGPIDCVAARTHHDDGRGGAVFEYRAQNEAICVGQQ